MNDFTKEELRVLLLEMNISIHRTPKQLKVSPYYIDLRDKIQSLIDSYCEHESIESYVEKERSRITPLTTVEEYDRLKKELSEKDARFQFGKQCGYFAAICAVDHEIKLKRNR